MAHIAATALAGVVGVGALAGGAFASSNTYYAAAATQNTSGCSASAPCTLDAAIAAAGAGDTVIVTPGEYTLTATLSSAQPITLEGQAGKPRPSLIENAPLTGAALTLTGGAVVQHLDIQAHAAGQTALSIDGGVAQDLTLKSMGTEALLALDSAAGTTVRTVLAVAQPHSGPAVRLADGVSPGSVLLENVTAVALGPAGTAISDGVSAGTATVRNTIASGPTSDIVADAGAVPVAISHSAFRPAAASGYAGEGANVALAPVFSPDGDFAEDPSSPTIGAGMLDGQQTATDLDGNAWTNGNGPDIGAYEYVGPPAPSAVSAPGSEGPGSKLPKPSAPVPGKSVTLRPEGGTVTVRLPHGRAFVALTTGAQLPVGTVINATHGTVRLTSAIDHHGDTKTGTFTGSSFVVRQTTGDKPNTVLTMTGGSFAVCTRTLARSTDVTARIARSWGGNTRVVRRLWGHDRGGRFTTIGRTAAATVRGTVWLTEDRCDGTYIKVLVGHVAVYDRHRHRTVVIGPGHAYLART